MSLFEHEHKLCPHKLARCCDINSISGKRETIWRGMWQGHLHEALGKGIWERHMGIATWRSTWERHMGALRHDCRLALGRVEGHPGQGIC